MNGRYVNRAELLKYIKNLTEDVTITICATKDAIPIVLRFHAERVATADKIFIFLRNTLGLVVSVWVIGRELAPEWVPTAPQAIEYTWDAGKQFVQNLDFSFPHSENVNKPFIVFNSWLPSGEAMHGVKYVIPPTGSA